jgi:hypothetical protein
MQPSEHLEAIAFVQWVRRQPSLSIVHIPNEGRRSPQLVAKLKSEGFASGFPDYIVWRRADGVARFVELKRSKRGKTSKEQQAWLDFLGPLAYLAEGHEQAIEFIRKELL